MAARVANPGNQVVSALLVTPIGGVFVLDRPGNSADAGDTALTFVLADRGNGN
jgi:hypothetical protein